VFSLTCLYSWKRATNNAVIFATYT